MEQKVQDIATVLPSLTYRIEPFTYTTPYEQLDQIEEWPGFEVHQGLEKDYFHPNANDVFFSKEENYRTIAKVFRAKSPLSIRMMHEYFREPDTIAEKDKEKPIRQTIELDTDINLNKVKMALELKYKVGNEKKEALLTFQIAGLDVILTKYQVGYLVYHFEKVELEAIPERIITYGTYNPDVKMEEKKQNQNQNRSIPFDLTDYEFAMYYMRKMSQSKLTGPVHVRMILPQDQTLYTNKVKSLPKDQKAAIQKPPIKPLSFKWLEFTQSMIRRLPIEAVFMQEKEKHNEDKIGNQRVQLLTYATVETSTDQVDDIVENTLYRVANGYNAKYRTIVRPGDILHTFEDTWWSGMIRGMAGFNVFKPSLQSNRNFLTGDFGTKIKINYYYLYMLVLTQVDALRYVTDKKLELLAEANHAYYGENLEGLQNEIIRMKEENRNIEKYIPKLIEAPIAQILHYNLIYKSLFEKNDITFQQNYLKEVSADVDAKLRDCEKKFEKQTDELEPNVTIQSMSLYRIEPFYYKCLFNELDLFDGTKYHSGLNKYEVYPHIKKMLFTDHEATNVHAKAYQITDFQAFGLSHFQQPQKKLLKAQGYEAELLFTIKAIDLVLTKMNVGFLVYHFENVSLVESGEIQPITPEVYEWLTYYVSKIDEDKLEVRNSRENVGTTFEGNVTWPVHDNILGHLKKNGTPPVLKLVDQPVLSRCYIFTTTEATMDNQFPCQKQKATYQLKEMIYHITHDLEKENRVAFNEDGVKELFQQVYWCVSEKGCANVSLLINSKENESYYFMYMFILMETEALRYQLMVVNREIENAAEVLSSDSLDQEKLRVYIDLRNNIIVSQLQGIHETISLNPYFNKLYNYILQEKGLLQLQTELNKKLQTFYEIIHTAEQKLVLKKAEDQRKETEGQNRIIQTVTYLLLPATLTTGFLGMNIPFIADSNNFLFAYALGMVIIITASLSLKENRKKENKTGKAYFSVQAWIIFFTLLVLGCIGFWHYNVAKNNTKQVDVTSEKCTVQLLTKDDSSPVEYIIVCEKEE
ncbi:CorA family divalent cation transporter [Neobacillus drentensis]|uniref:CorA family divalent cation transporter n=1 Tax=Neobacillus drentensis TaxID=220684 RepID=UPI0008257709|nr:CorA family divalent cation transporter [Neobacillus drentensis]